MACGNFTTAIVVAMSHTTTIWLIVSRQAETSQAIKPISHQANPPLTSINSQPRSTSGPARLWGQGSGLQVVARYGGQIGQCAGIGFLSNGDEQPMRKPCRNLETGGTALAKRELGRQDRWLRPTPNENLD